MSKRHEPRGMSGQGLVEFALMLPVLLLLIIGTLDLGSAFFVKVVMENSAREGASYMVYNTADGKAASFALTKQAVQAEAAGSSITIPLSEIDVKCMVGSTIDNTCPSGSTVVVRVEHPYASVLNIFSGPLTLVNEARMLIP